MTALWLLVPLLAQSGAPAPSASAHRVGVISVGPDAAAAGELARAVEVKIFSLPKISLKSGSDLAAALAAPGAAVATPTGPDAATLKEESDLLQQVSDAYYQDRAAVALEKLGAISAMQEKSGSFAVSERVRVLLWRAAVYLALNDELQAEQEAASALVLAPELAVDLNEFKPSVKAVVDGVKSRGLRMTTIVVNGLPLGAQITVDDRTVPARFQVPAGKHTIVAAAPRRRAVTKIVDAAGDTAVTIVLPIAIDPAISDPMAAAVWSGIAPDAKTRGALAQRLGVEWLVVVAHHPEGARAALIGLDRKGAFLESDPVPLVGAGAALAPWLEKTLLDEVSNAKAAPAPQVASSRASEPSALALSAVGGMAWSTRAVTLSGGARFGASFSGVGPDLAIDAAKGALAGGLDASYTDFGISTLDVTRADGSKSSFGGGTTLRAVAAGGWRHVFGAGDPEGSPSLTAGLGLAFDSHHGDDVTDSNGTRLGLLPSYQRINLDARAAARVPFAGSLAAIAGLAVSPAGVYSETPTGSSGSSPKESLGYAWNFGLAWQPATARWNLAAVYSADSRQTTFTGPARVPSSPAITNATRTDSLSTLSVTARWRF